MSLAVTRLMRSRLQTNALKHKPTTRAGLMMRFPGYQGKTETACEIAAAFEDAWLDQRSYFSVSTVHAWARLRSDPHEFEAAVHDIADRIEATPQLIDYHRRRTALREWCIDPASWNTIVDQLRGHGRGQQPELGDRQRDWASIIVWSRITGSERILAPHPIRDQQPAAIAEQWRQRAAPVTMRTDAATAAQQAISRTAAATAA
jgi:hypothetical protein